MAKKPIHSWTDPAQKDRTILILLKRSYTRPHIAPIFNKVFQRKLTNEGLPEGLAISTLDGQYQDIKKGKAGYDIYDNICKLSQVRIEIEYASQLDTIQKAVRALRTGITYTTKALPSWNQAQSTRSRTGQSDVVHRVRRNVARPLVREGRVTDDTANTSLQAFAYDAQSQYFQEVNLSRDGGADISQTTPKTQTETQLSSSATSSGSRRAREPPPLLFRATPTVHEFRARKWHDATKAIAQPPTFGTHEFKTIAMPHLERDKTYPSPFISLSQNARVTLKRVETAKSEEVDKKMFFVIFSYVDLEACAIPAANGDIGPYLVPALFPDKLSPLPDGYRGCGEWLMYGAISCEPVAILDSAQAIELARALRGFRNGSAQDLITISQCLRTIPDQWRKHVAEKLLNNYCRSKLPDSTSQQYRYMIEVVVSGNTTALRKFKDIQTRIIDEETDDSDYIEMVESPTKQPKARGKPLQPIQPKANNEGKAPAGRVATVNKLNALATTTTTSPISRTTQNIANHRPSPLWSPDTDIPAGRVSPPSPADDELEYDFCDDLPESAARKIQRNMVQPRRADSVLPSVETSQLEYDFISGLKSHAYAASPAPAAFTGLAGSDLPWTYIHKSTAGNVISSDRAPITPRKRPLNAVVVGEVEEDEDVVTTAPKRKRDISFQFRSLSVQEPDV